MVMYRGRSGFGRSSKKTEICVHPLQEETLHKLLDNKKFADDKEK